MQFSSLAIALTTLVGFVSCTPNGFIAPTSKDVLYAGGTFILRWNKTDGGSSVALKLLDGPSTNLQEVLTISSNLTNNGAVRWSIPDTLSTGKYALEIIDGDDADLINYTSQFKIVNNVTSSSTSSSSSYTAAASSSSASSIVAAAGVNGTNSTSGTNSSVTTTSSLSSLATSAASSGGSAAAASDASSSSSSATSTGTSSSDATVLSISLGSALLAGGLGAAALLAL